MPKRQRWTTKSYQLTYSLLTYRDGGERCQLCGRYKGTRTTKEEREHGVLDTVRLQIDEIDGDPGNHDDSNLRLLCRWCNLALGVRGGDMEGIRRVCVRVCGRLCASMERRLSGSRGARKGDSEDMRRQKRDRERVEGKMSTRVVRELVDYSQGSPEMQVNSIAERSFRSWCLGKMREHNRMKRDDAIYGGAEVVGISPDTVRNRYLRKLTSPEGVLQEIKDDYGVVWINWKEITEKEKLTAK